MPIFTPQVLAGIFLFKDSTFQIHNLSYALFWKKQM